MKTCEKCGARGSFLQLSPDGLCGNCVRKMEIEKASALRDEAKKAADAKKQECLNKISRIIVTTGDINRPYEIIGPVYFQVSNKGIFGNALEDYVEDYRSQIEDMKNQSLMSADRTDWGFMYGEWSVGQSNFEKAFYIATQELKKRGDLVGADAIICMRQDIDIDTNGFSFFYLQMYGTAVKFTD